MGLRELITSLFCALVCIAPMSLASNYVGGAECAFTRYPTLCGKASSTQINLDYALIHKTILETTKVSTTWQKCRRGHRDQLVAACDYCDELMNMSLSRLNKSLLALKQSPRKNKENIQTWLSAALTFQQACKDSVDGLLGSGKLTVDRLHDSGKLTAGEISSGMDYLSQLGSNALALINRISGKPKTIKGKSRRVVEEVQLFPKWVSAGDRKLLQSNTVKANVVVAKDGTGNYATISEAIRAASGNRFVIYVKAGVYKEKIRTNKDGITLIGDGKYSTVIVWGDSNAQGKSLQETATFTITGDGFIARDIGFQNSAGPEGRQAIALNIASDHSVLFRCSVAGYQDTLYALAYRQFYRECDIYGTIDFIFGNAAAVFQNCNLVLRKPGNHGSYNAMLASGRSDPGQNTGFSVQKCKITASSDFSPVRHSYNSYLGRGWKEYARSVVMDSTIDDLITPRGWIEWPGTGGSALKTLYFAEYANVGPGAGTSRRVQWPGFHVIGPQEAIKFTVGTFIGGTSWLPSTGVTFVSGLQ